MLRFVLVTASHTAVKRSNRLRQKYLSIVRRVGKNRAIVAVARILAETVYKMLREGIEFTDKIDSLTERRMRAMSLKARNAKATDKLGQSIKLIRGRMLSNSSEHLFS